MADATGAFYCLASGLEENAEGRCGAEEIFVDGEPFFGGVDY